MSVSVQSFLKSFPEFVPAPSEFEAAELETIGYKLADAEAQINPDAYGDQTDTAIGLLAAHMLTLTPFGKFAVLDPKDQADGSSTYQRELNEIIRELPIVPMTEA